MTNKAVLIILDERFGRRKSPYSLRFRAIATKKRHSVQSVKSTKHFSRTSPPHIVSFILLFYKINPYCYLLKGIMTIFFTIL